MILGEVSNSKMNSAAWMEFCVLFETRSGLTDPFLGHLEVSLSLNLTSNESVRYIADIASGILMYVSWQTIVCIQWVSICIANMSQQLCIVSRTTNQRVCQSSINVEVYYPGFMSNSYHQGKVLSGSMSKLYVIKKS